VHMKSFLQLKTCSINQQKVMWERKPYLDPLKKALCKLIFWVLNPNNLFGRQK
jgi:hypothetical protein